MLKNMPLIVRCVPDLNDSKRMKSVMGGYPPPVEGLDMRNMTCSKCGVTEFTSDMALKKHRDELHGYKSRSWKIHQDVIRRTYMPVNSLQIEKLLEMKW